MNRLEGLRTAALFGLALAFGVAAFNLLLDIGPQPIEGGIHAETWEHDAEPHNLNGEQLNIIWPTGPTPAIHAECEHMGGTLAYNTTLALCVGVDY